MAESSSSVTLPSSLAFLVSNFHSLVTIKLETGNYLLWKTQVINALRANGYISYLDGSIPCPAPTIRDSTNNSVSNPEFLLWTLIDNQLLSCVTASLSVATLPHVLGLTHVSQVWSSLEQRFNSLTKSHIHELKSRLYNVQKTGTMENYIDEIRNYKQRLEAVGHHVDDDDLVFYVLKGLPPEFNNVKSGLRMKGDVTFDELTSILHAEEAQIHRDEGTSSAKVFAATQNLSLGPNQTSSTNFHGNPGIAAIPVSHVPIYSSSQNQGIPMYQGLQGQGPYQPQQFFTNRNMNSNGGYNKGKGVKGTGFGQNQKQACQICGKTNHTAFYCYHRQNLQFQPPSFMTPPIGRPMTSQWYNGGSVSQGQYSSANLTPQANVITFSGYNGTGGPNYGPSVTPNPSDITAFSQSQSTQPFINGSTGISQPFINGSTGVSQNFSQPSGYYSCPAANVATGHSSNWIFDSGASTHITNDLSTLTHRQPCSSSEGVIVGNGTSLPVTFSGQANSTNTSQGAMSSGPLSTQDLL